MTTCNALGKQVWQSRTCSYSARTFQRLGNMAYTTWKWNTLKETKETSPKTAFRKSLKTYLFQDWNYITDTPKTDNFCFPFSLCTKAPTNPPTFPHPSHPTPTSPFFVYRVCLFLTSSDIVWTRDASLKHHHHYYCHHHHHLHHSDSSWTHIPASGRLAMGQQVIIIGKPLR